MAKEKESCVEPAAGPIDQSLAEAKSRALMTQKEEKIMKPLVGNSAPDFEANVYFEGGFKTLKLSNYKGKWILLCFYPGDFTFV